MNTVNKVKYPVAWLMYVIGNVLIFTPLIVYIFENLEPHFAIPANMFLLLAMIVIGVFVTMWLMDKDEKENS